MKADGTGKYYVSKYELYPIYEPAEGGYYYNGVELVESHVFSTRKKAMRKLRKLYKELKADYLQRWNGFERENEISCNNDHTYFRINSQYVGEGFFWQLEKVCGVSESGWQPYC